MARAGAEHIGSAKAYGVAVLAGALAGVVGAAFRAVLVAADNFRIDAVGFLHEWPLIGWIVPVVVAGLAVAIARYLVVLVPEAAGSGVQRIEAQVRQQVDADRLRVVPAKFVGGALAIGSGLALGREGPTVQMSAAIGSKLSTLAKVTRDDGLSVQSALAGAGLGVAFNAPLGGVIFVVEELTKSIRMKVIALTMVATAVAVGVMRLLLGSSVDFEVPQLPNSTLVELPLFIIFGLLMGLMGAFYSRTIIFFLDLFEKLAQIPLLVRAAIVGAAVGLLGWFVPNIVGGGDNLTQQTLTGSAPILTIAAIVLIRWFLGPVSYSVSTPGGLFAPLMVLGAGFGGLFGGLVMLVSSDLFGNPVTYALVGMAAFFGAVVRAPITGIVLVVEMTATNNQFAPLMLATAAAVIAATLVKSDPIYDTLRDRMHLRERATSKGHDDA